MAVDRDRRQLTVFEHMRTRKMVSISLLDFSMVFSLSRQPRSITDNIIRLTVTSLTKEMCSRIHVHTHTRLANLTF